MNTSSGTSNITELPYNNISLNIVENGNKVLDNKIQNEISNRELQTQVISNNDRDLPNESQNNDQIEYNNMISQLQKASQNGATDLPSRDIPMNTNTITQDPQINPNYIPENNNLYINDNDFNSNINNDITDNNNNLDDFYNNLQTPILLFVLYFLIQLPLFKKYLFKYLPKLFNNDGNQNIYGYIFYSLLFSLSYVGINYLISKLNENL